ncbi:MULTISPECIES: RimK family alpha-L-glutamate ligase [unclassified Micromonospora]|uniref:RimK family alpha-L-glutamate ligase n=1 Tax=unclassified Micromonospora TaxID=2617518 RepID=UPI001C22A7D1|nr:MULTISPECIES: RimK family alpha-L-glutamate ligase [unclassified Micromonospora]MBU8858610.1 RimK family alpha-L-glutamate ligase [Micromonospora sp. WMMB482]MDM4784254.1 RimK family alpha-L-glutamate ligase [Micromonospora sp. b486]
MTTAGAPARVAVLTSRVRADEKRILQALDDRRVPYDHLDSRTLWRALASKGDAPAQVVLNREIGYARALAAGRVLEAGGAVVLNTADTVALCGDKYRTSVALRDAGLPSPATALALTPEAALNALEALGYPAVIKPRVGSWGRLVTRVRDRETAEAVLEHVAALPSPDAHIVYLQQFVAGPDRDIRIVVIGGEAMGATYRRAAGWRHNVARGAGVTACPLTPELAGLAEAAARAVGADIAGVDLVEDTDGRLYVLEVNHGVEFSGFQEAMGDHVSVADRIVDHLVDRRASCFG